MIVRQHHHYTQDAGSCSASAYGEGAAAFPVFVHVLLLRVCAAAAFMHVHSIPWNNQLGETLTATHYASRYAVLWPAVCYTE